MTPLTLTRIYRRPPGRPDRGHCEEGGGPMADELPALNFKTVLLIDAFKEDREYWAQRLHISSPNYVVLETDTAAKGLAICQSHRVDCVVFEMNLPDMAGFGLLIKLVQRPRHPEIAVILLSRIDLPAVAELAKDHGAQAFLVKSHTSGDQLSRAIHRAIAHTRHSATRSIVPI